jgi:hypothetical protein
MNPAPPTIRHFTLDNVANPSFSSGSDTKIESIGRYLLFYSGNKTTVFVKKDGKFIYLLTDQCVRREATKEKVERWIKKEQRTKQ